VLQYILIDVKFDRCVNYGSTLAGQIYSWLLKGYEQGASKKMQIWLASYKVDALLFSIGCRENTCNEYMK